MITPHLTVKARLVTPYSAIKRKILTAAGKEAHNRAKGKHGHEVLKREVRDVVYKALMESPTVIEMLTPGSPLHYSLGLTNMSNQQGSVPDDKIAKIIETCVNSINVTYSRFSGVNGKRITGKIVVTGIPEDHEDLLSLPEAFQDNTFSTNPDAPPNFEYLRWLLVEGDQINVVGYHVSLVTGKFTSYSRTTYAVMKRGGSYSVPQTHTNFITKAVTSVLDTFITESLKKVF